jgi:hypothetical protein
MAPEDDGREWLLTPERDRGGAIDGSTLGISTKRSTPG